MHYEIEIDCCGREQLEVRWSEVTEILGHEHDGSAFDDKALIKALLAAGAPSWIKDASGYIDRNVWALERLGDDD